MLPELRKLNDEESNLLLTSPALVTILIAGAEGNIDQKEIDWGTKIAHFRAGATSSLQNVYREVDKNFSSTLSNLLETLPKETAARSGKINSELGKLNGIFEKLEPQFAREFHKSLVSLAKQVAKASGGLWGYGSISAEEQRYLELDVINPPYSDGDEDVKKE